MSDNFDNKDNDIDESDMDFEHVDLTENLDEINDIDYPAIGDDSLDFDMQIQEDFDDGDYAKPTTQNGVNWFNIGIIGVVVLGIAGLTYMFFPNMLGGNTVNQQNQEDIQLSRQENQLLVQQAVEQNNVSENEESFFDNPTLLESASVEANQDEKMISDNVPQFSNEEINDIFAAIPLNDLKEVPTPPEEDISSDLSDIDTLPMPSDANPITIEQPLDENNAPNTNVNEINDITVIEPPLEIIEEAVLPQPTAEIPVVSQAVDEPATPGESFSNDTSEITKINARIDAMNTQMESFMSRLESKLESMGTPSQQPSGVDNSDQLNQLQQTISRLENRLNTIESAPVTVETPVVTMADEPKPEITIEQQQIPDVLLPTPEPVQAVVAPKRREPAYVPPKAQYDLRGASNGQAVIAQKGTQNLQTVTVGSVVRGLGTIRSIAIENGQWVVRGTDGIVRQ